MDLLLEIYDDIDSSILEMVLEDAVVKICIEEENGIAYVEQYLELLESGKLSDENEVEFCDIISESFLQSMSVYGDLIIEAPLTSHGKEYEELMAKNPGASARANAAGKEYENLNKVYSKRATLREKLKGTKDTVDNSKFAGKLKELKAKLGATKYEQTIKSGLAKAKKFTSDTAAKVGSAVTGGVAYARRKAGEGRKFVSDKATSARVFAGKKMVDAGVKANKFATAMQNRGYKFASVYK